MDSGMDSDWRQPPVAREHLSREQQRLLVNDSLILHGFCIQIADRDREGLRRSSGDVAVALSVLNQIKEKLLHLRDNG